MNKILFTVFGLMFVVAAGSSYYIYFVDKSYDFFVEAPCDAATHTCFVRDCDGPDGCPPNNLGSYRQFIISAKDFAACTDNSCLSACESGAIRCEEVKCGDSPDDSCSMSQ